MVIDPPAPTSKLIQVLEHKLARSAPWDAADLALLRRALAHLPRQPDPRALVLIVGHCGESRSSQDAALLTACLWAARHRRCPPSPSTWNLGRSLRAAPAAQGERIWRRLCTASPTALPRAASAAVEVLAENGLPTDWHRLHRDLRSWYQGAPDAVLRRWCTGLYGPSHESTAGNPVVPLVPRTSEVPT